MPDGTEMLMFVCAAYPKCAHFRNEMEVPDGISKSIFKAILADGYGSVLKGVGAYVAVTEPKFLPDPRRFFGEYMYRILPQSTTDPRSKVGMYTAKERTESEQTEDEKEMARLQAEIAAQNKRMGWK